MAIPRLEKIIRKHIDPDERLLWSGKPRQDLIFMSNDAGIFLFSLPFIFMPLAILYAFFEQHKTINLEFENPINLALENFELLIAAFVCSTLFLGGIYMSVGRFFFDIYSRKRLVYGLTNKRAIIVRGKRQSTVISYEIDMLTDLQLVEYSNGYGTIRLSSGKNIEYGFSTQSKDSDSTNLTPDYSSIFFSNQRCKRSYAYITRAKISVETKINFLQM